MTVVREIADTGSLGICFWHAPGTVVPMVGEGVVVWYNPRRSKCQGAEELLAAYGVPARRVRYLDDPPSAAEIARVLTPSRAGAPGHVAVG